MTARHSPPVAVTRHTRRTRSSNRLGVFPAELVTTVLEFLPVDELWTVARVSQGFYATAWRAGLFIHRKIDWSADSSPFLQLSVFKEVLEHARRKDLRLSLEICADFQEEYNPDLRQAIYAAAQPVADELFPVISAALPLLVYLSTRIPDHFRPRLNDALRCPAPKLRSLELFRTLGVFPCTTPLPLDLFTGLAPQLRVLTLGTVTLPDVPLPAFQAVSNVSLVYGNILPPIDIGRHFPRLTDLRFNFIVTMDDGPTVPDRLDVSGLALRVVVVEDGSEDASVLGMVERSVDLSTIPTVGIVRPPIRWNDKIWTKDAAELFMRATFILDDDGEMCILVVPAHRRWRRLYGVRFWDIDLPLPVSDLPNLGTRLTYLRLDTPVVEGFLMLELAFPALRDLHVDVHEELWEQDALAPPDYDDAPHLQSFCGLAPGYGAPRVWAPCAALQEITLFAVEEPITDVDSRCVAFLAHALGQLQRPKTQRATLALVGVEFAHPVARALLGQTVSAIRKYAFAGLNSPEDCDGGLWEYELFERE